MNKIYILYSFAFPFCAKIGVSNAPKLRRKQVQDSIVQETGNAVKIRILLSLPILFAYQFEQKGFHPIFRRLNRTMPGSGRTEWFWAINPISAFLMYGLYSYFINPATPLLPFIGIVFAPLPLDFALLLLSLGVFQAGCFTLILFHLQKYVFYEKTNIAPTIQGTGAKEKPGSPTPETKPSTGRDI